MRGMLGTLHQQKYVSQSVLHRMVGRTCSAFRHGQSLSWNWWRVFPEWETTHESSAWLCFSNPFLKRQIQGVTYTVSPFPYAWGLSVSSELFSSSLPQTPLSLKTLCVLPPPSLDLSSLTFVWDCQSFHFIVSFHDEGVKDLWSI